MSSIPFREALEDCSRLAGKVPQASCLLEGEIPVIGQGKQAIEGFTNDSGLAFRGSLPVILFGDHTAAFKFIDYPFARGADGTKLFRSRSDQIDAKYAWHFLQTIQLPQTGYDRKTKYLESISIPLPPLEEQRRIAAILDKIEKLITATGQALRLSQKLKESLVQEALLPAGKDDERTWARVRDVAEMITGFPFKSAQYTDNLQHVRLCRGINVLPGRIEWKQLAHWPEVTKNLNSFLIQEDDVLIAMDRPWIAEGFKIALATSKDVPSLLVQRVARIRAGDQILPRILFEVLSSRAFAAHCKPTETTVPHISPVEIRDFEFEIPSLRAQEKINSILVEIEKSQNLMNGRMSLLREKSASLARTHFN